MAIHPHPLSMLHYLPDPFEAVTSQVVDTSAHVPRGNSPSASLMGNSTPLTEGVVADKIASAYKSKGLSGEALSNAFDQQLVLTTSTLSKTPFSRKSSPCNSDNPDIVNTAGTVSAKDIPTRVPLVRLERSIKRRKHNGIEIEVGWYTSPTSALDNQLADPIFTIPDVVFEDKLFDGDFFIHRLEKDMYQLWIYSAETSTWSEARWGQSGWFQGTLLAITNQGHPTWVAATTWNRRYRSHNVIVARSSPNLRS